MAATPASPAKKRRVWPWILLGVLVVLVGGCGLIIFAIDEAVDDLEEQDRRALEQTTCAVTGVDFVDDLELEITVTNTTSERSSYFIEYEILDADGTFLGDGFASITNVPPGSEFTEDVVTFVDAPSDGISGLSCAPIDVDISASN